MPVAVAIELAILALFVVATLVGAVLVPFDHRRRLLRVGTMGVAYLSVELMALVALWALWLSRWAHSDEWWEDVNARLLGWALGLIIGAAGRCLGFKVTVDQPPGLAPLSESPPVLVLARHGGLGDSVALVWLLLAHYQRKAKVVLKAALQWEPLLDVTLNRLGACFLPPAPTPGEERADRLGRLAAALKPGDALLLFPEGANWTPRRRLRAIERLRAAHKRRAADVAALMDHVLPPRPAGVIACLDARPGIAVVVFAHTGLDTLTRAGQTWRAIPFERAMKVRWWPSARAPEGEEAQLAWLTAEWAVVDEWIDSQQPPVSKDTAATSE
jgi:1-acyl-sn-glycerol-3-phosphate acyltransferase